MLIVINLIAVFGLVGGLLLLVKHEGEAVGIKQCLSELNNKYTALARLNEIARKRKTINGVIWLSGGVYLFFLYHFILVVHNYLA